jgi:hypothetical protein
MERTFALLQGNYVANSIVADDSFIEHIKNEYTAIIETTDIEPTPGIGCLYDFETKTFTYPQPPVQTSEEEIIDVEEVTSTPAIRN